MCSPILRQVRDLAFELCFIVVLGFFIYYYFFFFWGGGGWGGAPYYLGSGSKNLRLRAVDVLSIAFLERCDIDASSTHESKS